MATKKTSKTQSPLFPKKKRGRPPGVPGAPKAPREKKRREDLPENQVTKQCNDWLAVKGWTLTRQHSGLFSRAGGRPFPLGEKGLTDWRMERPVHPGGLRVNAAKFAPFFQIGYLEYKAPGKTPSDDQLNFMEKKRATGTPAMWFDSLKALKKWYKDLCFDIMAEGPKPVAPAPVEEVLEEKRLMDNSPAPVVSEAPAEPHENS
jgi:hypothetical protein